MAKYSYFYTICSSIEGLLRQLNTNTDELNGLQDKVDARVKQHVDVREELLLKKDKQMKGRIFSLFQFCIYILLCSLFVYVSLQSLENYVD